MAKKQKTGKGGKKIGRNQRKKMAKNGATSLFVKNKINFETYLKMIGNKKD